jgi:aryl-alcohol dehydrogenase-like predicted oxidoreductase
MRYTQLGKTDIQVSILALGCWAFGGGNVWGEQDDQESINTVHAALDMGVNFFDTAPAYGGGRSEEVLGNALKGKRQQAIIADKVSRGELRKDDVLASCDHSLKLLQTDYIDLLQIHWPNHDVPFDETVEALFQLKQAGKVRAIGVCNHGKLDIDDYMQAGGEMISNQLPYSLLWRAIEFEVLPKCEKYQVGTLPYSPLMQGLLTGKYRTADDFPAGRVRSKHFSRERSTVRHGGPGCEELTFATIARIHQISEEIGQPMGHVALAWLYQQPSVISTLTGARTVEQLQQNVASVDLTLGDDVMQQLCDVTDELKQTLGPDPDIWMGESRFR